MSDDLRAKHDYWRSFWRDFPGSFPEDDFFGQVGHTIDGKPYSADQLASLVSRVISRLKLSSSESVLDVCCGNGLITSRLAEVSGPTVGLDFSPSLVAVAEKHHARSNISYECADALALAGIRLQPDRFSRILMYAALQHFQVDDLETLLLGIAQHATDDCIILFGYVLDLDRKFNFLDTREKRARYERYCAEGKDRMGTWWSRELICTVCERAGFTCKIDSDDDGRPGGHYRFDAVIERKC